MCAVDSGHLHALHGKTLNSIAIDELPDIESNVHSDDNNDAAVPKDADATMIYCI